MDRRLLGALMASLSLVWAAFALAAPDGQVPTIAPAHPADPGSRDATGSIPNVDLLTQDNQSVRFYDDLVKGKTVIIHFMFTSCDAYCPLTTANLARVQAALGDRLGRDIFLYSVTLDPEHDTPEVLKRYRGDIGAKPGWTFLTGARETIERLRRRLGVYDLDPAIDADKSKHSGVVVYGNDLADRWAAMPGLAKPDFIARRVLRVAPPETGR